MTRGSNYDWNKTKTYSTYPYTDHDFYAEWFSNRLREGYVCVRNPYFPDKDAEDAS